MRKQTKIWTTKDGTRIRICDMTDSHLLNTIALLKRIAKQGRREILFHYPDFQGEMAQFYAEQSWEGVASTHPDDFAYEEYPILEPLEMDAERRGLEQPSCQSN
jgi:hypothetical protein